MNPNLLLTPLPQTPSGNKGVNSGGSGGGGGGGINSNIIAQLQKDVDPIAFLNQSFPTEESLDNLEGFVKTISDQVSTLDQEMATSARIQAVAIDSTATEFIESARSSVSDLFEKMSEIAEKAEQSETMVQHLCADIQRLDNAKRNLELSFHTMKRLQILINAVDQLEIVVADKDFRSSAALVDAINLTVIHFEKYTQVPLIADLQSRIAKMTTELKKQMHRVFREMSQLIDAGISDTDSSSSSSLSSAGDNKSQKTFTWACLLVDKLGRDFVSEIIDEFVNMQLIPYDALFGFDNKQHCGVDQIDRRWAWLKRIYKTFDSKFASIFPGHWLVSLRLGLVFYDKTVVHLNAVLLDNETKRADALAEVPSLLKAIQSVLRFEMEMSAKFEIQKVDESGNLIGINDGDATIIKNSNGEVHNLKPKSPKECTSSSSSSPISSLSSGVSDLVRIMALAKKKLPKGISCIFDRYLGPYVLFERKNLEELLTKLRQEEDNTSGSQSHRNVFDSSTSMFVYIRNSIKRCTGFVTGTTFLSLCKEFKTCMQSYADLLRATKCPAPLAGTKTVSYEINLCYVINTAEYCAEVVPNIEHTIKQKLDPELVDSLDMSTEVDVFSDLVAYSIKCLVASVIARLEPAFRGLSQIHWGGLEEAEDDVSPFSRLWLPPLTEVLREINGVLTPAYYNNANLKIATDIIKTYQDIILRQKKISEMGAQQLLLDTYHLKQVLLKLHQLGSESSPGDIVIPSMYLRFVNAKIGHVENILKLICTPEQILLERFDEMKKDGKWPEGSHAELQLVMAMRGSKKTLNYTTAEQKVLGHVEALKNSMDSMTMDSAKASMSTFFGRAENAIDSLKKNLREN